MTTRRLTAILAADVVGFSTLMGRDEEGTLSRIKTNGTAPEIEIEERVAMAMEGGVPALYAPAFAEELQRPGSDEGIPRRR